MALIGRVIGLSLLAAAVGAAIGLALFQPSRDATGIALLLACVGGLIGAVAGAAREIVSALRQRPSA